MLAIRLQRVGRKGHAMYRLVIQESQRHPSSGRVVAYVGTYDPHTKNTKIQVELAQKYLDNGAQPSPRVIKLLKNAGVKLPTWVKESSYVKSKTIKNNEKLRKNQPKVEEVIVEEPEKVEEVVELNEATEDEELVVEKKDTSSKE